MTTDKTKIALRVLDAVINRRQPNESDLTFLHEDAPDLHDLDPDEIACIVIQRAVGQKGKARESRVSGGSEGLWLLSGHGISD